VPRKRWAYVAVKQLLKAGVIYGYGDDGFNGDCQLTRYELAQITAKAMARADKAGADKIFLGQGLIADLDTGGMVAGS